MRRYFKVAGLALVFLYLSQVALAQVVNSAFLDAPITDTFPLVSTYLEVRDAEGRFVSGLKAGDVAILENDQRIPVNKFVELQPGAQFVVAMNPGPAFAPRDSQGKSRYDTIVEALAGWVTAIGGTSHDDLSLMMNGMQDANHLSDPAVWLDSLNAAPSDHRNSVSNLQVLSRAISVAAGTPPRAGMGRAVLFITPNLERNELPGLENLGAQARQNGVRLFVWMVTSESYFTTQSAVALQEVAFSTGGQYFAYSGTESFPNLEDYLEPLRSIYALTYSSKVVTPGEQTLAVEINSPKFQTTSEPIYFQLEVLPPNPILVSPPADLNRSLIADAKTNNLVGHEPEVQILDILIEFPDGYERSLVRTTLYVNGKIADENTDAPFDQFTWNLNEISASGKYEIQVEAVDELGLSHISLPHSVNIVVQQLPQGFAAEVSRRGSIISAVAVLISGSILILALVFVIRRRHDPNETGQWRKRRKNRKNGRYGEITRPNPKYARPVNTSRRRFLPEWATQIPNRFPWSSGSHTRRTEPYAYLERVYDGNSLEAMTPTQPIPIMNNVITLGTDPTKATLILEEPSIAGQHARVRRDREGNFYVLDHGTVAGTWINFAQTNGKEVRIYHGDLIHLGRVGFRFRLSKPPKAYEPEISFE